MTSKEGRGGRRYLPYVFTEQGIAMLSAVLRSDIAIQVSIRIMETFVEMRKYMANTSLLYDRMNAIEERQITYQNETNEKFDKVFAYISDHEESQQKIFFDGQIYDAFSLLIDLVASATKSLVLVDNYVDVGTLNILSKKKENVSVTIYTVRKTRLSEKDIETFNQQYPKLEVNYTGVFHDRFLIIDDKKAYHIGASLKDAGKKCFAISVLNDSGVIYDTLQGLDIDTEGLLLLTNDGALTHHLLSPAHHIPKTYYAEIDGYVTDDTINLFATGVDIGDEKPTLPADLRILSSDSTAARSEIELIITEGRFHQVKRMFEAVGMKVTFLRRIAMGELKIDESLPTGAYRSLSEEEVSLLRFDMPQ